MKKLTIAAAVIAFAGVASAAEYHQGAYLLCYDCHTMHASQQHNFTDGNAPGAGAAGAALFGNWQYNAGTAYAYLLKGAESSSCVSCHDGHTFAPDVVGADFNTTADRSAGSIADGSAGHETWKGHTIGGVNPPGDTQGLVDATAGLQCFDCHKQHGTKSQYRNLGTYSMPTTFTPPTYAYGATLQSNVDVTILTAAYVPTGAAPFLTSDGKGVYNGSNITYAANGTLGNAMNNFCAQCHGNFHGTPGTGSATAGVGGSPVTDGANGTAYDAFLRHPTSGIYVGQYSNSTGGGMHGHTAAPANTGSFYQNLSKVKVAWSQTGAPASFDWTTNKPAYLAAGAATATPMCISCHNAHGSTKPFGLKFLVANAANTDLENGDGAYRNLCGQCHGQGAKGVETRAGGFATAP